MREARIQSLKKLISGAQPESGSQIVPEGQFECPVDYGFYDEEDMFGLACGHK